MEQRVTPEFFCGAGVAALCGLLFGLVLHIPWQKHPGGPQILFGSAQAAEPSRPISREAAVGAAQAAPTEIADLDTSYVEPAPLPVVRLHPEMFDVQPAAAGDAERQDADEVTSDDTVADLAPPRDLD